MTAPPIPTFVPQDAWYKLSVGQISPSEADTVPNAAYLSPIGDGVAVVDGLVGSIDGAILFLAGNQSQLDGGQRTLIWRAASLNAPDGSNIFCPFVNLSTPGRWEAFSTANGGTGVISSGQLITSGDNVSIFPSIATGVMVVVRKTVGSPTILNLPPSPLLWQSFTIKDGKGDAGTNFITILGNTHTIDGIGATAIAVDSGSITLVFNGTEWNMI